MLASPVGYDPGMATPDRSPPRGKLYLGLPFWGHKEWVGRFYRPRTPAKDHLSQYGSVFNTVEGNTTFYSLPSTDSVSRWRDAVPGSFRFSFKVSRQITHELQLTGARAAMDEFLQRLSPLGSRLGPFLIQLPPSFGPDRLPTLDRFLESCPAPHRFAVEVRHRDFFADNAPARRLDDILRHRRAERCWMDTRALRCGEAHLPEVREARRKKPDLPVRIPALDAALGSWPLIRFVAHPDPEITEPWIRRWTGVLAQWIRQGRTPFFMVHLPDNTGAPALAAHIHQRLSTRVGIDPLPAFPADTPDLSDGQLSLL